MVNILFQLEDGMCFAPFSVIYNLHSWMDMLDGGLYWLLEMLRRDTEGLERMSTSF